MKRTLPALVGLVIAAGLVAGAAAARQPLGPPPRPPAASRPPPLASRPLPAAPRFQPAAPQRPPPRRPNSLGADWGLQQDAVRQGVRQRQFIPLGRVIAKIGARHPGRQLDTGLEYQNGRAVYRVRWMTRDGRRVDYLIDASTGAILRGG